MQVYIRLGNRAIVNDLNSCSLIRICSLHEAKAIEQ